MATGSIIEKNRSPCAACRGLHKKCDTSEGYPCKGCKSNGQKARLCRPSKIRKSSRTEKVESFRLSVGGHPGSDHDIAAMDYSLPEVQFGPVQTDPTYFVPSGVTNEFQEHTMSRAYVQTQNYAGGNGQQLDNMHESKPLTTTNSRLPSFGAVPSPNVQSFEANQVVEHVHSGQHAHGHHGGRHIFTGDAYPEGFPSYDQDAPLNISELTDGQGMWSPEGSFHEYPTGF